MWVTLRSYNMDAIEIPEKERIGQKSYLWKMCESNFFNIPCNHILCHGLWNAFLERQIPIPWLKPAHMTYSNQRNLNRYKERGNPKCAYLIEVAWALASTRKEGPLAITASLVQLDKREQTYSKLLWPSSFREAN